MYSFYIFKNRKKMADTKEIKVTYFNLTGRAEISRLILAYAGVK